MFCMTDMEDFHYVVVKNTPEKIAELHERSSSVESMRNMSAKHWIQLNFPGDLPDVEILNLVSQSFQIVQAKYTRK